MSPPPSTSELGLEALHVAILTPCVFPPDILSAALDSGVAISIILIYFALFYPKNGTVGENNIMTWWGNVVFYNTADYGPGGAGTPLSALPPGATFG